MQIFYSKKKIEIENEAKVEVEPKIEYKIKALNELIIGSNISLVPELNSSSSVPILIHLASSQT